MHRCMNPSSGEAHEPFAPDACMNPRIRGSERTRAEWRLSKMSNDRAVTRTSYPNSRNCWGSAQPTDRCMNPFRIEMMSDCGEA
jgi:hypothetical protein